MSARLISGAVNEHVSGEETQQDVGSDCELEGNIPEQLQLKVQPFHPLVCSFVQRVYSLFVLVSVNGNVPRPLDASVPIETRIRSEAATLHHLPSSSEDEPGSGWAWPRVFTHRGILCALEGRPACRQV